MTRARCALAALLLGVLAVVAGASTANGAAPVPTVATGAATGGTSTAGTATVGAAPAGTAGAGTSAGAADVGAATAGTATASAATARAAVADIPTAVGTTAPAPRPPGAGPRLGQGTERTTTTTTTAAPAQAVPGSVPYYVGASGELAVSEAGHEHPRAAADPAQTPRAGSGRAYLLSHAPPPPYAALPPCQPGPAGPRDGLRQVVAAASFGAPRTRPGELPGVRGPPGRTAGSTTGHPSRSADPAPLPH